MTSPQLPAPTGLTARYQGQGNASFTTTFYYWIQALYPGGWSALSNPANTGPYAPAALSGDNLANVQWNPAPGAIGYLLYKNTTGVTPTSAATAIFIATSETGFKDDGSLSVFTQIPRYDGFYTWKAVYSFTVDGGAVGAIIPSQSDIIPANAIIMGAIINSPTAVLAAAGAATISIGTTAGSSAASILIATSKASFTIDAIQTFLAGTGPFGAAAFKMSAAGQINMTVATNPLTAGVIEIYVFGIIAVNP